MSRIAMSQIEPNTPEDSTANYRGTLGSLAKLAISGIRSPFVWLPLLILVGLTIFFRTTDADTALVQPFYVSSGCRVIDHWPMMFAYPWKALYDWGYYPAWILGCGGLAVWLASFRWTKLKPWRDPGLYYGLVFIIGPGIIVNGMLKPYWGRPRPNAIVQFGGEREFLKVWEWGGWQDESSFPSGHASTGFYLMVPAFVYYRRRRGLALAFVLLGILSGITIGIARIVAGGHFPSDILWAGGVVYFTALFLAIPFRFGSPPTPAVAQCLSGSREI